MTTPANPDDLLAFVRAQLDADERVARAAANEDPPPWHIDLYDGRIKSGPYTVVHIEDSTPQPPVAQHIARHDPARVLRRVAADRRILDEVVGEATGLDMQVDNEFRVGTRDEAAEPYLGDVLLRLLALPYAGRDGYREEWRPA